MNLHFEAMQSNRSKEVFYIHWNLGKRCNFDCIYCPDSLHDFTSTHKNLESLQNVIYKLLKNIDKKYIRIWFTGGEPTVNPFFLDFCKWIKKNYNNKFILGLNTNGSRTYEYYVELLHYVDTIQFSSHFQYIEMEKFKNNLYFTKEFVLTNKNKYRIPENRFRLPNISLNLMMEPEYWDSAVELVIFCEKNDIDYSMKRIRKKDNFLSENRQYLPIYTENQIKFLNDRTYREKLLNEYENLMEY